MKRTFWIFLCVAMTMYIISARADIKIEEDDDVVEIEEIDEDDLVEIDDYYDLLPEVDFEVDGVGYLVISDGEAALSWGGDVSGNFAVPSSVSFDGVKYTVTRIEDSAFAHNEYLKSVDIPSSVIEIGAYAFNGCSSLVSIDLPNSLNAIEFCAFVDCGALKSIAIPSSVNKIGGNPFVNCYSLESFDGIYASADHKCLILDGVLVSFAPCNATECKVPEDVTSIGLNAFNNCKGLKSVSLPSTLTEIGAYSFYMTGLSSVDIPQRVTTIRHSAFEGCKDLTAVRISGSVTEIGSRTFDGCTALSSITLPNSVTVIDCGTFVDCVSLASITLPDSLSEIDDCAFAWCSSLASIVIPSTVTEIGYDAFHDCSGLKSITLESTNPGDVTVEMSAIEGINPNCVLYVPKQSVELYKSSNFSEFFKTIIGK